MEESLLNQLQNEIRETEQEISRKTLYKLIRSGYGNTVKPKDPELDLLQETILEKIKQSEPIAGDALCHDLRMSPEYGDISKNLNGSLSQSVSEALTDLLRLDIIYFDGDGYCHNKKSKI